MSQKFALIIGNSEYEDTNLARLMTPGSDVQALTKALLTPEVGGFDEVVPLINESAASLLRAIARLFAGKKPDDLLLLYFSGHGVRDDQGDLYLAVKDTERDLLSATAISAAFITGEMDRSRSRRQVLILDCCHSGAFARGSKGALGGSVGTATAFEGTGYGRVVLTASDSTQYAWEGDQVIGQAENSLFTHFFIQGMATGEADANADGCITIDELYDYVYEQVVNRTPKQTPGKWSYKQQGEIVIAKNPLPVAKLPPELVQAIEHPIPEVREGAVRVLDGLLHSVHKGMALAAEAALKRLVEDDSHRVSTAAKASLARHVRAPEMERITGKQAKPDVNGIITISERGTIEVFNPAAERIFGYAAEEVMNRSVSMLMPSPYREEHDGYIANYLKTGVKKIIGIRREVVGRRKDGTTFPMDIAVTEVFQGDRRTFTAILQDITARKRAEEELLKTKAEFEAAEGKPAKVKKSPPKTLWISLAAVVAVFGIVFVWLLLPKPGPGVKNQYSQQHSAAEPTIDDTLKGAPTVAPDNNKLNESQVEANQPKPIEIPTPATEKPVAKTPHAKAPEIAPKQEEEKKEEKISKEREISNANMLRSKADAAKNSMQEAKDKVKDSYASDAYQQATSIEQEANNSYRENNFEKAAELYKKAQELYATAASEASEKIDREQKRRETVEREIQNLIGGFKAMLENKNYQLLQSYKEDQKTWSEFLKDKDVKKIQVAISNPKIETNQNKAKVDFTFQMVYEQKGIEKGTPPFTRIWTLEEQGDKWVIISMKEK